MTVRLLVFGHGYTGAAILRAARAAGLQAEVTSRTPDAPGSIPFAAADAAVAAATHVVSTAPPGEGDPVLGRYGEALRASPSLRWAGYLSTTGVYGDRGGGWVDEDTEVAPGAERARRRVAAEQAWRDLCADASVPLDLFRVAGIYGPGRSVFDDLRAGTARRIDRPGHAFGRVHRDDIAGAVLAAARQQRSPTARVLHLADDEPAASAEVVAEAARLLGREPPPLQDFATTAPSMSAMALSFWGESRRVASAKTQAALGRRWTYPTYREGLRAILAEETLHEPLEHREVGGA